MLFLDTYSFLACVQTQTHAAKAMFVGRSKRVWEVTVIMAQPLLSFICLLRPGSRLMQQSPCSKSQVHTHTHVPKAVWVMKEQQRAMNCNLLFVFIRAFSSNLPTGKYWLMRM